MLQNFRRREDAPGQGQALRFSHAGPLSAARFPELPTRGRCQPTPSPAEGPPNRPVPLEKLGVAGKAPGRTPCSPGILRDMSGLWLVLCLALQGIQWEGMRLLFPPCAKG